MKKTTYSSVLGSNSQSHFDKIIEWLLISLLIFMPLALGAVESWSEEIVILFASAISICFLLKLILEEETDMLWSWSYVPVLLFILVVSFQLISLPSGIVHTISPNTVLIKNELLADLPNSNEFLRTITLSFYPAATKHILRLVLSIAAIFIVVVNVYRREEQIKRLLSAIALIGGSIALIALAQDVLGNGKIYWVIPTWHDDAYSGTFINHSHYGQFMNLSIGAALGLVILKIHEAFVHRKHVTPPVIFEYLSSPRARQIWLLIAVVIIGAATIFVSLTRGGMISMFVAATFSTLALSRRKHVKGWGWIVVLLALGAFICVLYTGFDAVYDRLSSLRQLNQAQAGRWQIVRDILLAWAQFPLFGTGLGTHEVVYPMFDSSTISSLAAHAENEYAQTLEETGFIGLGTLLIFGVLVWIAYIRCVKKTAALICTVAYGLGFGLMAILIHSLSDFGQHLPANAILSAISCAILIVLARMSQTGAQPLSVRTTSRYSRAFRVMSLFIASGICIWALAGSNNARLAERHWKRVLSIEQKLMDNDWFASDEEYADLIAHAAKAADYQPEDVKYKHWLNVYRWKSLSRNTDPDTDEILIPEQAMQFVPRIIDEFNNARMLCPTFGATYCIMGQLEKSILDDPNGSRLIRKGYRLAPCDPVVCFENGLLDVEEDQIDASLEKFQRAVQLDKRFFGSIADIYVNHLNRPDLALVVAGDDIERLSQTADAIAQTQEHEEIAANTKNRLIELLKEKCSGPDVSGSALVSLGNMCAKENDMDVAIQYYRQALDMEYGQVKWRVSLAELLAQIGDIPEAMRQAEICLHLNPQYDPASNLIARLKALSNQMTKNDSSQ